jgi:hypothetical protein
MGKEGGSLAGGKDQGKMDCKDRCRVGMFMEMVEWGWCCRQGMARQVDMVLMVVRFRVACRQWVVISSSTIILLLL